MALPYVAMVPFFDSGPKSQVEAWLASEKDWTQRLGRGWKGTRFLGKGGFGIAGLWEYQGDPAHAPSITKVVVKQAEDTDQDPERNIWGGKAAMDEGVILKKLSKVPTNHIIKQYGGNRLGDQFMDMGSVVRIFLEYCPGGDLEQFVAIMDEEPKQPLDEEDLWAIFNCLAIGLLAMHRGTEVPSDSPWPATMEICHYDIKPDNIFLGYRDKQHLRLPVVKIADFGEALEVEQYYNQTDDYGGTFTRRGNMPLACPEETINMPERMRHPFRKITLLHPRKGTCSNIWQLGGLMNILLLGKQVDFNADNAPPPHISNLNEDISKGLNHSIGLNTEDMNQRFSKNLRALIMHCLMREPEHRPSSTYLAMRTAESFKTVLAAQRILSNLPEKVMSIPLMGLKRPEPPTDWEIDTSEFDLAQRDVGLIFPQNTPSASLGNMRTRLGAGLVGYVSKLSSSTAPPRPSAAATSPPTEKMMPSLRQRHPLGSLESWTNLGFYRSPAL